MIVTGDDPDERKALQEYLSKEFEMKDLGTLKYFLGIEVSRSQQGMLGCKPVNTPIKENHKLGECTDHKPTNKEQYQRLVGRSSAEAKYRGMAHGVCELLWIKHVLTKLGFKPKKPMKLYCDNIAAINIAHNPVQHDRTKHVEVDRHFIKERLEDKTLQFPFVKSEDQLADILTKAVSSQVFQDTLSKLDLGDIYAPT
ncbi:unnamed protein product [Prunus armeniaca]